MIQIKNYEKYLICSNGEVYSTISKKFLNQTINKKTGYSQVRLGRGKNVNVHKLVSGAYLKSANKNVQVNHIDGNKLNNDISNLEYVTQSENMKHAWDTGLRISSEKHKLQSSKNGKTMRKLSNKQAMEIFHLAKVAEISQAKIGKIYNVSAQTVNNILHKKRYKGVQFV